jgi:hypothetical protein
MLGLKRNLELEKGTIRPPLYRSEHGGGFITQFVRPQIRKIFEKGEKQGWSCEKVLAELVKQGDMLKYAKITFIAFDVIAVLLLVVILLSGLKTTT